MKKNLGDGKIDLLQVSSLKTRTKLLLIIVLVIVIVAVSLVILFENTPSIVWQSNLEYFATNFTVDNGKIFVCDSWGNVYCFDSQSGASLWNTTVGSYVATGPTITVYEDKVYVGSRGSVVNKLDENTGKIELTFQAPASTSYAQKSPPQFFVADGKVFTSEIGLAVYYANTGDLLWESAFNGITLGDATDFSSESSYVFVLGTARINPNNGTILWRVAGAAGDPAVVAQGRVILWNYSPEGSSDEGHTLLCLNASSGDELWHFNVGARMFQPTVSNDMILFGAENGLVYVVNLSDGTLKWKTLVDNQLIIETYNGYTEEQKSLIYLADSLVYVDLQHQRVFWSVIVSDNGQGVYNGTVWALDLSTGDSVWVLPVSNNALIYTEYRNFVGMTLSKYTLYVTEHSDIYFIDENTGDVKLRQNFEHYVLPAIVSNDKVFVAADLYLRAYG
jgi:outer membrane protein assembly factor BamB